MIQSIIKWSIQNRIIILAVAVVFCFLGVYTSTKMPIDVFPDLTAPTVTVMTEAHGMAPSEVETQITFPLEASINGAPGVRRVRSSSAAGFSIIWVEFQWGTDMYLARQIVTEKIAIVEGELPPQTSRPILAPASSIMGEIMFVSLSSEKDKDTGKDIHDILALHTLADTEIRKRLLSVAGVSQVVPTGGGEKQYQVILSPTKLRAYDISVEKVTHALSSSNENISAGFINERGLEYIVTGIGRLRTLDDINKTVVDKVNGVPIYISDVAQVDIGEGPKRGEGSSQAKPAVILSIQKQPGVNTLQVTQEVDKVLDEISAKFRDVKINKYLFRQADFIEVSIHNVLHALRDGGILVIVIVFFFLGNIRATLITLTAIPLSLLAAVLTLRAFGATINTMTLGGMAIAIGMLVDDAIIDVENVFRRLRENSKLPAEKRQRAFQIIFNASVEVRTSIVFATIVIALVFLPLFFLSGVEGRLLQPLGVAYLVSLLASLVVAISVVPALCYLLLPKSKAVLKGLEPRVAQFLKKIYEKMLNPILNQPWIVTACALALFVGVLVSSQFMGHSFLPEFNEGALTVNITTPPGTSLPESNALANLVEETILTHPEVKYTARRTGRAELDEHSLGVESSEIEVSLEMKKRSKEEFLKALRNDLSKIPGVSIIIGQPISHRIDHMLSGSRANIAVKIFGDDLYKLRTLAEIARREMDTVEGVVDLFVEPQVDIPILKVRFNREALARHGIHVEEVAHTLEAAFQGRTVSRILEGKSSFDLVVKIADEKTTWDSESIGMLIVDTPSGAKIPLKEVAYINKDVGPNAINREQVQKRTVVMCNVAGRDVISVVDDIKKLLNPIVQKEKGYSIEYGGQFESATEASRLLTILGIAVVLTIGFLLHLAFGSVRDTLFVMLNLPLALIGGVAGVFVSGGVLSVASLIGFITVFGIATRNGIMLISHIRHLQEEEGVSNFRDAVLRGAKERLVPILMTALAAGLALVPLALGGGKPGNEIQTPMAIVILFGLLSSTLLNMIVVPTLYLRWGKPRLIKGDIK